MATSKLAYGIEKAVGHDDNAITQQDVSNYNLDSQSADNQEKMKALVWIGKNKVEVGS